MTEVHSRKLSKARSRSRSVRTRQPVPAVPKAAGNEQHQTTSLRLHIICIIATLLAASIFTLTEHDDHGHTFWCAFEMIVQTLLVVIGTLFFRTRLKLLHNSSVVQPILIMVVTLTLLCDPFQRFFLGHGHPLEVLVMHSQSNLMLALAVCGFRIGFQRLAMLIAVFLTIFSCTISNATGLLPLTIAFSIGCLIWLVAAWWETVHRRLVNTDHQRRPLVWLGTAIAVPLLLMLTAVGFGANTVTTALQGFMPSSGGTGQFDPFSRGGVNDGDALVAGNNNIKSFAPLEDAPFLDTDKPSLYDMFNDTFDEPPKISRNQERSIALLPEELKHVHQKMAEAKQAGREFTLVRENTANDRSRIRDLDSHAAFYVAGPVPAHFRMEVYEHFDGLTWYPVDTASGDSERTHSMELVEDRHWLRLSQRGNAFEVFSDTATHGLKVANLDGNVVPSPPQMVGVSIDDVHRADMYSVADSGIVSLQRESVPELTPINVASHYVSRHHLAESRYPGMASSGTGLTKSLPGDVTTLKIRELAEMWTKGVPTGWPQVEAIEARLRQHCVLDRDVRLPADCACPVSTFLFETQEGPEYLFASSAACLLRSLGYSTRLVSGFYARPDNYDGRKRHTAVFADDAHFWCEVCIGMDTWMTVEASPGYRLLTPPLTLWGQLLQRCLNAWHTLVANVFSLLAVLVAGTGLMLYRHRISEMLLTCSWRWMPSTSSRERTLALAALIDRRLRLAGSPRGTGTTLQRCAMQPGLQHVRQDLQRLSVLADTARFSPSVSAETGSKEQELLSLEGRLSVAMLRGSNTAESRHEPAFAQ